METSSDETLLSNLDVLDVTAGKVRAGYAIRVRNGLIAEIAKRGLNSSSRRVDLEGRVVMPALIDGHVHCSSHLGARRVCRMMRRGFTTVRDAGGTDAELRDAVLQRVDSRSLSCRGDMAPRSNRGQLDYRSLS